ncbi:MAG: AbrB/MazE/SpoVT family DNA-binding domain-containing protein [Methanomassiliicoccales archaeon]|nr:AbrB/MazE/SpoVT family DNA-binding domain-containing protein [Methanomassiliicoccales archaeon]
MSQEIIEPLAKFHSSINIKGQLVVPAKDRDVFGLNKGDYLEIIVRSFKVVGGKLKILKRAYVVVRLSSKGLITIPEEVRKELNISPGDTVEILIVGYHKFDELVSEKGKQLLKLLQGNSHTQIISSEQEKSILQRSRTYYL